jgi:predicted ATP-grasp superfamily ATP-dependent carboligase
MALEGDFAHRRAALILGDDPVNALGVARNLGRAGVWVSRLGAADSGIFHSRYIRSTVVVPEIDHCSDLEYVSALKSAVVDVDCKVVLFPLSDLHVLKVARNASSLADRFLPITSSLSASETLVNKRQFYESLAEMGIPHPATCFPRSPEEFETSANRIGYPVFLKPEISPLFSRKFNRKGFVAHDSGELLRHLKTIAPSGLAVVMQEIIPGSADCLHGCAGLRTPSESLLFCYRRLREFPAGFGTGSLQESIPLFVGRTRLLEYLQHIGYTGIFEAEFKLDPRDGVYKLIEINARAWWQTTHATVSGLNVVTAAYDYATGIPVNTQTYRVGTKWVHLYNDFFAARVSGLGFLGWVRSLQGEKVFDIWATDDLRPMLSFISNLAWSKLSR